MLTYSNKFHVVVKRFSANQLANLPVPGDGTNAWFEHYDQCNTSVHAKCSTLPSQVATEVPRPLIAEKALSIMQLIKC